MSDANESKKNTLNISTPPKLQLTKTSYGGKVKQNFTHGRSKSVTVEVRKTRTFTSKDGGGLVEVKPGAVSPETPRPISEEEMRGLSPKEREYRMQLLKNAEEQAKRTAQEESERAERQKASAQGKKDQPATAVPSEAQVDESGKLGITRPLKKLDTARPVRGKEGEEGTESDRPRRGVRRGEDQRRNSGKITVSQALGMSDERTRSLASIRRQREKARKHEIGPREMEKIAREVIVPEVMTVQELANRMAERGVDVIKALMKLGVMATVNQNIDADTAELIATELGHKVKRVTEADVENVLKEEAEDPASLQSRAPVVTIMGHVDHGKTSLLDALRKTDVVATEAGGITQHIGAYQVTLNDGDKVTFLDTPGHEAFTAMRARGAKVTDIVVIVVAADDGVKEQTKEAISHAKAAQVPIIVAINKIDKPGADPMRVKNELLQYELVSEDLGGDVMVVEVSAKQRIGLEKLIEVILLQSEVLELKANPTRTASGTVIEAKIDRGRGVVATLLVQRGTLRVGDIVVAGAAWGRIRAITDDKNRTLETAGPSLPIEIQGLNLAPEAGDEFGVVDSEKTARDITEYRHNREKTRLSVVSARSLDQMFAATGANKVKELPIIVKADVQGSVEAIISSLMKFNSEEVAVKPLHSGVGAITESDITLAHATGAVVIGFNVRAIAQAKELAERDKVDIRYYSVIYDVVDEVKAALGGMLSPTRKENFLGYAEIRQVFTTSKSGKIAGCMVTEGVVKRGAKVRLLRDNVVIHEGTLKTLKRFKEDAKEVKSGLECGMAFENYEDIREGDRIEAFEIEEVARTME